jgi:hypothetical protein
MDNDLKNTLNSEGMEKKGKSGSEMHQAEIKRQKIERILDNSIELFGVIYELSRVFYLYWHFEVSLDKIAATVTLVEKIKRELTR